MQVKRNGGSISLSLFFPKFDRKMIRTRLVWFTSGFLVNGGAIAYFLHRDLSKDRYLLVDQLKDNFGALEARVANLESVPHNSIVQDGGSSS